MFFYLADTSNQRPFVLINKPSYKSILIYSSPALAHFLLKERNLPGQVMAFTHEETGCCLNPMANSRNQLLYL